ncbi:MAG: penicillin-binding protein [Gemmatimonadales bacterium]
MARVAARIRVLEVGLLVGALIVVGRAGYLQLVKGQEYAKRAAARRTSARVLEAPRGRIYDRDGELLATSLHKYRINIAGEQVLKPRELLAIYRRDVGDKVRELDADLRAKTDFYAHGPYSEGQVQNLRGLRGVYLVPVYRREYPSGQLARPLVGRFGDSGGLSGLERSLDSLLAGLPGQAIYIRDSRGRTYESPGRLVREPVSGHHIVLTIDRGLQAIAEAELAAVFDSLHPTKGDVLFLDPRNGEILAAASREADPTGEDRGAQLASASYFTQSFEPGSTAKPLTAAALLELGRVDEKDTVSGHNGQWHVDGRPRPVTDVHVIREPITLRLAIEQSSNVAMGQFALKLKPEEHYDFLRAFGLASPTGVEFPGEDGGRLPGLKGWSPPNDGVSLAIGYAMRVTPVQLAAAYGALANDGILMAPSIIREVRAPDGKVIYRHEPTPVRRVVSSATAARIREYLLDASGDAGTGSRSQVKGIVLGKTGTALVNRDGRYTDEHAASFAAIYPARDPQLVVVVRIEQPAGAYYGGAVAAPIVRRMLVQALAAQTTALDRTQLAEDRIDRPAPRSNAEAEERREPLRRSVTFPLAPESKPATVISVVPNVVGQTPRAAAATLHQRGFRVNLEGTGVVRRSSPAAGDSLAIGKTVSIVASGGGR